MAHGAGNLGSLSPIVVAPVAPVGGIMPQKESTTVPTHLIFESVARRIDAGTYLPKLPRTIDVPAVNRPMRAYLIDIAVCAMSGGVIGYLLGSGAQ